MNEVNEFVEEGLVKCPFCAEKIKNNEKKCPYCNSFLKSEDKRKWLSSAGTVSVAIYIVLGILWVYLFYYEPKYSRILSNLSHKDKIENIVTFMILWFYFSVPPLIAICMEYRKKFFIKISVINLVITLVLSILTYLR